MLCRQNDLVVRTTLCVLLNYLLATVLKMIASIRVLRLRLSLLSDICQVEGCFFVQENNRFFRLARVHQHLKFLLITLRKVHILDVELVICEQAWTTLLKHES